MFFGDGNGHFGAMSVIVDTDVLNVGQIVKVNVEYLSHEGRWLVVQVLMVEVIEGFFFLISIVHIASFSLTM